jgi:hypothetical protein
VVNAESSTVSDGGNSNNQAEVKPSKVFGVYTHAKPDGTVFYVGKGTEKRARNKRRSENSGHCTIVGKHGTAKIVACFYPCESEAHAFAEEIRMIAALRSRGIRLVNKTDGGEGASGHKASEETKRRLREALTGKKKSPEHIEKVARAHRGRKFSSEHIAKLKAAHTGKKLSQKHRQAMSAAQCRRLSDPGQRAILSASCRAAFEKRLEMFGEKRSAESCAKSGAARKGKRLSAAHLAALTAASRRPEVRAKKSAALKGRIFTQEWREKQRRSHLGKKASPETRAKQSAALKGKKRTPEVCARTALANRRWLEYNGNLWSVTVGYLLAMKFIEMS